MNENITWGLLLKWGIDSGYSQTTVYITQDGTKYHVYENMAFTYDSKNRSPLDIYLYKKKIQHVNDLGEGSILVFTKNQFIEHSIIWEKKIRGYFERLLRTKNQIDRDKKEQSIKDKEEELALKNQLIKEIERFMDEAIKPTIKLIGDNPAHFHMGTSYYEYGYIANDVYGNDITDDVVIDASAYEKLKFNNLVSNSEFGVHVNSNNNNVNPIERVFSKNKPAKIRLLDGAESLSTYTASFFPINDLDNIEYTVSVYVKPQETCNIGFTSDTKQHHLCAKNKWRQIEYTYKPTPDKEGESRVRGLYSSDLPNGVWLEYKNYKVEIGSKATEWTPSPDDEREYHTEIVYSVQDKDGDVGKAIRDIIID